MSGKIGTVVRPCFNSRSQEFLGWKIAIAGEDWVFTADQLEEV